MVERTPLLFIVEDDGDIHNTLRLLFHDWRYITAVSLEGAERILPTLDRVDLVILDYQLKRVDGENVVIETTVELCAKIKKMPGVPIIAYSGLDHGIDLLRAAGATDQIRKPASNREIAEVVTALVGITPGTTASDETRPAASRANPSPFGLIVAADARPVERATIADLDLVQVTKHIAAARERNIYQGTIDPLGFLVEQQCLVNNIPTAAGVLMFGVRPERLIPNAVIDLLSTEEINGRAAFAETFSGTIPQMIDHVMQFIWEWIEHRGNQHEYPRAALREITTNALCHRDWVLGGHVRVILGRNRLSWISPGGLSHPVTRDTISEQVAPRNPTIARLLRQSGYGAQMGQGWRLTASELRGNGNAEQELGDSEFQVRVTIIGRPLTPPRPGAGQGGTAAPTSSMTDLLDPELRRATILAYCQQSPTGLSPKQIKDQFPRLSERTIERDLRDMVRQGLLIEEGNTRKRVYRVQAASTPEGG